MKLSYDYPIHPTGYSWSLKPFSIQISQWGITLLKGNNGSGKSNFLKILAGILTPALSFRTFQEDNDQLGSISGLYQPIPFDPQLSLNLKI